MRRARPPCRELSISMRICVLRGDVFPDKVRPYAANLAYGVTTTRYPSIDSNRVFPYSEMVEIGEEREPGRRAKRGEAL